MADATATAEKSIYDVKIEDVGAAKKRLTVTVPAAIITEKIEESMGTLATQTSLPGFRKWRAPKALLERRFGTTVRHETKTQVIADGYAAAIEEHSIKPVGEPEPVGSLEDLELEIGKPLTFAVEVEVLPEFDLPDLATIEIVKPIVEVEDDHIQVELDRQCTQAGQVIQVDSGFEEGDRLLGPGTATKEGDDEPFFSHDNVDIIVPSTDNDGRGQILGLLIDGLSGTIDGKTVGDELTFTTTGPDAHELEHIRGKKITIQFTIRDGQRIEPAKIDDVIAQYGMASQDVLREQIKLALEQRRDEEVRSAMREQACEQLLKAVEFEVPEKLSDQQAGRMLERQRLEMMYRGGLSADEVEVRLAEMRAETETQSRDRLRLMFLLHRLASEFDVQVSDQEVNGRIAAIASQRRMRPEKLRADLLQSGGINQIASQIREHKAADRVIDKAKVTEVTSERWDELVKERRGESGATGTTTKTTKKTATAASSKKTTTKKSGTSKKKTTKKKTT